MARTLIISDIHLGQRGGGLSVLMRPRVLAALLSALEGYDRLVLLGDTVELQETHAGDSFPLAEPVLRSIAQKLGPEKQLLLVPGNHDHALVSRWARAQGAGLARENVVPPDASPLLEQVVSWLEATRVEVHYPGLWLSDTVWATHGHFLNHYLRPISSWGLHPPRRFRPARGVPPAPPAEFEYIPKREMEPHMRDGLPPERWLDRHIPTRFAPLTAHLLDRQMQRHALPAMAAVAAALGVDSEFVLFGHVHRRGPLGDDDRALWSGSGESPRLINTGSWRYEPVVARGLGAAGPYWPGGAVSLCEDGVPRSIGLLDGLDADQLLGTDP